MMLKKLDVSNNVGKILDVYRKIFKKSDDVGKIDISNDVGKN